ncbi:MAG: DUF4386 domain-containing protein [Bacteroidetes bacterium]|nr:MAG: DUF4386 domain-containing protein [Bacteroidota bacterium]
MNTEKRIGWLLISGAILLLIPYTLLTMVFDYPDILREDPGVVLTRFHAGGNSLIWIWWSFAMTGIPLLFAYVGIGQLFENQSSLTRSATVLGIISGITQIVGLLRWTFVVPVLASAYVETNDESVKSSISIVFQAFHQFGGVVLGEHLGQLFTIAWTVMIARVFAQTGYFPRWVSVSGYVISGIYLLAQAELFATVMPGFPVWDLAGFLGSTLWLLWLVVVGVYFVRR